MASTTVSSAPLPPENVYGHTKKLRFILEILRQRLDARGGDINVLDFGCGNGSAVSQFLGLHGVRYFGVDFHAPSLAYARAHFGGPDTSFVDRVPEGVVFDVLLYSDVLEHLDDPVGMIREHAEVLAPDGWLVGSVPNGYGPFENEKRLDRWLRLGAILDLPARVRRTLRPPPPAPADVGVPYNDESGHVQFFTRRTLQAVLREAGFRVREFRNGAFIGAPVSERYVLRGPRFPVWNARVADRLPAWAVSTWYFVAERV